MNEITLTVRCTNEKGEEIPAWVTDLQITSSPLGEFYIITGMTENKRASVFATSGNGIVLEREWKGAEEYAHVEYAGLSEGHSPLLWDYRYGPTIVVVPVVPALMAAYPVGGET